MRFNIRRAERRVESRRQLSASHLLSTRFEDEILSVTSTSAYRKCLMFDPGISSLYLLPHAPCPLRLFTYQILTS